MQLMCRFPPKLFAIVQSVKIATTTQTTFVLGLRSLTTFFSGSKLFLAKIIYGSSELEVVFEQTEVLGRMHREEFSIG